MKTLLSLYEIAENDNIDIYCFELPTNESMSLMDDHGHCFIGIDPTLIKSTADEKVKLAHELGHCATGAFYNRYSSLDIRGKHERRADKWAIHRLIPREQFSEALDCRITEVWELAEYFNVTEDYIRKAAELYGFAN